MASGVRSDLVSKAQEFERLNQAIEPRRKGMDFLWLMLVALKSLSTEMAPLLSRVESAVQGQPFADVVVAKVKKYYAHPLLTGISDNIERVHARINPSVLLSDRPDLYEEVAESRESGLIAAMSTPGEALTAAIADADLAALETALGFASQAKVEAAGAHGVDERFVACLTDELASSSVALADHYKALDISLAAVGSSLGGYIEAKLALKAALKTVLEGGADSEEVQSSLANWPAAAAKVAKVARGSLRRESETNS